MTEGFAGVLELEPTGEDRFAAHQTADAPQLYGGLAMGWMLRAAGATVGDDLQPHSLHATFLRGGRHGVATELVVDRRRDGRAFATRHVELHQEGRLVATMTASFHTGEDGPDWHEPPAGLSDTGPEELLATPARVPGTRWVDLRHADQGHADGTIPFLRHSIHPYWVRITGPVPDEPRFHASALAFLSDYLVVLSAAPPGRGVEPGTRMVTLDHGLWLHRPTRVDGWLHVTSDPISTSGGRGTCRGLIHDRDGRLVASFVQEVLHRAGVPG